MLPSADDVTEVSGRGVTGRVEGHDVTIGSRSFVDERYPLAAAALDGLDPPKEGLRAYVTIDGRGAGVIEFADRVRPGLRRVFSRPRNGSVFGARCCFRATGSDTPSAWPTPSAFVKRSGGLLPEGKVRIVRRLVADGAAVLMVGDGTNDAPAMASATVGIALAGHGGGITAEAADVVLLVDDVSRVVDAVRIGQETIRIARQSIWVGLGLSAVAMAFAAAGAIPVVVGAVLQEFIDVAVILNALPREPVAAPNARMRASHRARARIASARGRLVYVRGRDGAEAEQGEAENEAADACDRGVLRPHDIESRPRGRVWPARTTRNASTARPT